MRLKILLIFAVSGMLLACDAASTSSAKITTKESISNRLPLISATPSPQYIQSNDLVIEPPIYNYASGSDYVVIALLDRRGHAGKVKKQETNPNIANIGDRVAVFVYSFRVEKMLCSREAFGKDKDFPVEERLKDFQIVIPVGTQGENYREGQRYLLFLKQIPVEEKLSSIYEVEKDRIYFKVFDGTRSIFPGNGAMMEGPPTKGIINMADDKYGDLIERIKKFCSAVEGEDRNAKIRNLKKLLRSDDDELKANAIYAIKFFKIEEN